MGMGVGRNLLLSRGEGWLLSVWELEDYEMVVRLSV